MAHLNMESHALLAFNLSEVSSGNLFSVSMNNIQLIGYFRFLLWGGGANKILL